MASKEQIQKALDELWTKYGNTLSMLSDALDKIDTQQSKINKLEMMVWKSTFVTATYRTQNGRAA